MPFTLLNRDITTMNTDAIVNAANVDLVMGSGVCGAIFLAAGADKLQAVCTALAPISTGDAVITPGFNLPARFIIHTAGPIYRREKAEQCREQLRSCYIRSLTLAEEKGCQSIAFPLISGGIYGYPREEAIIVAEESIREFLQTHDMDVYLLLLDKSIGLVNADLMVRVQDYLASLLPDMQPDHMVLNAMREEYDSAYGTAPPASSDRRKRSGKMRGVFSRPEAAPKSAAGSGPMHFPVEKAAAESRSEPENLDSLVGNLDESFSRTLLRIIDAKGRSDVEVYKRANLDRKLFSKIRTDRGYTPSKRTALALAVSLELNLKETEDLLARAGYALSHSQKFDVIVEYFIIHSIYDIYIINEALFHYDQPLLGG